MEGIPVEVKEDGEVSGEKRETTQVFLNVGHKVTKNETSFLYVNKRPSTRQMDDPTGRNDVSIAGDDVVEPITEPSHVAIIKTPANHGSNDNALQEGGQNSSVEDLLMKIDSVIDDMLSKHNGELVLDKDDVVEEDEPMVVERRPALFQLVHAVDDDKQSEEIDKYDVKENVVSSKKVEKSEGPITEGEVLIVERTPVAADSDMVISKEIVYVELKEDGGTTVETQLLKTESVIGDSPAGKELADEDKTEAFEEDVQVVVEKRPDSVHVDQCDDDQGEETSQPISESELEMIEKTPTSFESEILVKADSPEADDNSTIESLLEKIESAIDLDDCTQEAEEEGKVRAVAIDDHAPIIIERKPVPPVYPEHRFFQGDENQDKDEDHEDADLKRVGDEKFEERAEQILEEEFVIVEKKPCALQSVLLVEKEGPEDEIEEKNSVESLLVNIQSVIDHPSPEPTEETMLQIKEDALEEDTPVVVDRRPVSLHVELGIDQDKIDERKSDIYEGEEAVPETEIIVVKKTPVALESEMLVDIEQSEESIEYENATAKALLANIESVIDHPSSVQTVEPGNNNKPEVLEEDEIVIIEKRPASLRLVEITAEEISDEVRDKGLAKKVAKSAEPIAESEVVFEEKTTPAFESDILVEVRNGEEEFKDDENVTVESLLENLESGLDHPSSESVAEPSHEIKDEILEEVPVALERRPTSLRIEQVPDLVDEVALKNADENQENPVDGKRTPDLKEPIFDDEVVIIEKKPATIESELLIEQDEIKPDSPTVESLLVNIESVIDATITEQAEKKQSVIDDTVQETVPLAVDRKPSETHLQLLHVYSEEKSEVKPGALKEEGFKHTDVLTGDKEFSTVTITTRTEVTQTIENRTEGASADPTSVVTVTTTDESFKSTSYTNLLPGGDEGEGSELLLQVPKRRLSAPEVLPEKENDGSAPLATSESGLLDPMVESSPRMTDRWDKKTDTEGESVFSEPHPCSNVSEGVRLITDKSTDVEGTSQNKGAAQPAPVAEDEQELLDDVDEDNVSNQKMPKKGAKGPTSPQCKCCLLM